MDLEVVWDEEKNAINKRKHKISFKEAEKVFLDPRRIIMFDKEHSLYEERWETVGFSNLALITVIYTERDNSVRIISARKADRYEEEEYFYGYS
ncbi:hypothetical protein R84B8_03268 [Treponema sp. R8-4-B8]